VVELKKLKKYRCKVKNAKLYLQCEEIMGCFIKNNMEGCIQGLKR
jgi:hypothetical protein